MRIRLTLDIERRRPPKAESEPMREVGLDALVERGDPHPEPDRPIGFRRRQES
jgi:hypothetical protein